MKSATTSAPTLKRPHCEMRSAFLRRHFSVASLYLVRCPAVSKTKSTKKEPRDESQYSNALCRTLYRLVITVCLALTSLGCTRTADKFCAVDQETLKQNLIRLVESPVIKDDDSVNATSITIDSVEPLPLSDGKAKVRSSFAGRPVLATLVPTIPETGKPTCKRRKMDIVT